MKHDCTSLVVGDRVETVSCMAFVGRAPSHTNYGIVTRLTRTQVEVKNEHGNVSKYWKANGLGVGGTGDSGIRPVALTVVSFKIAAEDEQTLAALRQVLADKANRTLHLAAGVPSEYEGALDRAAAELQKQADAIGDELARRETDRRVRRESFLNSRRRQADHGVLAR